MKDHNRLSFEGISSENKRDSDETATKTIQVDLEL